jgi:drug/metabolite transporter (DMT)-like permease
MARKEKSALTPLLTVVTVRTLAAIALLTGWLCYSGISLGLPRRDLAIALLIGIPLCINNYMLNAAIGEIPVPLVVLIFYTWPALTTAASWLLGKERFRWRAAAGLALAFAGVALTLNVQFTAAQAQRACPRST